MTKRYLVTWSIDIEETADNPIEAAVQALLIQQDKESAALVYNVYDKDSGVKTQVDLWEQR